MTGTDWSVSMPCTGRTESGQLASIVEGQAALRQQLDMQASQSQSLRGRVSLVSLLPRLQFRQCRKA